MICTVIGSTYLCHVVQVVTPRRGDWDETVSGCTHCIVVLLMVRMVLVRMVMVTQGSHVLLVLVLLLVMVLLLLRM